MDKRTFIKTSALASAGVLLGTPSDAVNLTGEDNLEFKQVPLSYDFNALEPYIDAKTMEVHYTKHHAAYTKNFNTALKDQNITSRDIKEIFQNVSKYPAAVRNNGGGYYNHNLFWDILAPKAGGEPTGDLAKRITKDFGSFSEFKEQFSKAATGVFGSGWAWLIDNGNKLQITTTPNQDNPLMDIAPVKGKPILLIDVWEHAYYLKYQNRRPEFIAAFWNVVNWQKAEENLRIA